ncbi:MAG: hypothetical protein GY940_16475, partial [bacterium]|nr:hypothetical protein [bacterium]
MDKNALPLPSFSLDAGYVLPSNDLEKKLVEIWSEVLEIEPSTIGIDGSFFELGGHSLKAIVLVSRIHKAFNAEVPLPQLYEAPTVKELAKVIEGLEVTAFASIKPVEKKEYYE